MAKRATKSKCWQVNGLWSLAFRAWGQMQPPATNHHLPGDSVEAGTGSGVLAKAGEVGSIHSSANCCRV